ncbi:MAG: ribbon-helix-helix domain-containing protein [Betaproteobacteria bacterium]|nr:ribbon-helix-helix domain-containing protein [Betaproteobacteria bacterium]
MAITKPKAKNPLPDKAADDFMAKAPDAERRGVRKGSKQQISLTISPELLKRVDELAKELGQSRAAIINLAIYRAVEHGLLKE